MEHKDITLGKILEGREPRFILELVEFAKNRGYVSQSLGTVTIRTEKHTDGGVTREIKTLPAIFFENTSGEDGLPAIIVEDLNPPENFKEYGGRYILANYTPFKRLK